MRENVGFIKWNAIKMFEDQELLNYVILMKII